MKQVRVIEYFETEDNCSLVLPSEVLVNASLNKTRQKNVNQNFLVKMCAKYIVNMTDPLNQNIQEQN